MKNELGNKKIMGKNIQFYMDKNNLSRQDLCKAIGVKYTTLTDWIKGNAYPRIDKIELMANYFGVTKADLVEDNSYKAPSISSLEYEYIQKIRLLDEHSKELVFTVIEKEYERAESYKRLSLYAEKIKEAKDKNGGLKDEST